jgi:hypothetical protein
LLQVSTEVVTTDDLEVTMKTTVKAAAGALIVGAMLFGVSTGAQAATITQDQRASLLWMVAEEKLAHDVYTTLGDIYGVRQFDNIAASEATHTDAVRVLLDTYGIKDPTVGDAVGEFDNAVMQKMYDDLIKQGSKSLTDAAEVGVAIEKLDIKDLRDGLDANTPADVRRVYESLLKGSQNHLAAFERLLARA